MKSEVHYCPATGKFIYTSEAKATRAMNRYDDIRRTYFCDKCSGWHTTKMGVGLAVKKNLIKAPKKEDINMDRVKKRLEKLNRKIEKNKDK